MIMTDVPDPGLKVCQSPMTSDGRPAPLKILMLSHSRQSWDAGASSVTLQTATMLRARGHLVDEVHLDDISVLQRTGSARAERLLFPYLAALTVLPRSRSYNVIDATNPSGWPLFSLLRRRRHRPALVMRSVGLEHVDDREMEIDRAAAGTQLRWRTRATTQWRQWEVASAARCADVMICPAHADAAWASAHHWKSRSRIHVIPHGIHPLFLQDAAAEPKRHDDFRVLWWGSWIDRKGRASLPAAIEQASAEIPRLRLTLGGTGASPEEVLAAFPASIRARVSVLPFVSREEQVRVFAAHDCFLSPSLSEGFGLAALEAASLGLPVVMTATGVGRDLLRDGESALIVPKRDPAAIAIALHRLARSPDLSNRLRSNGRRITRAFTWERAAEQTEAAYRFALLRVLRGA